MAPSTSPPRPWPTAREPWRTDGTVAGTTLVADINPSDAGSDPYYLTPIGSKLYFRADDGTHYAERLWVTDGTAAGTRARLGYPAGDR
ncbi:MAG: hypothetical protein R3F30_14530 [Planctomycetota bacterium]